MIATHAHAHASYDPPSSWGFGEGLGSSSLVVLATVVVVAVVWVLHGRESDTHEAENEDENRGKKNKTWMNRGENNGNNNNSSKDKTGNSGENEDENKIESETEDEDESDGDVWASPGEWVRPLGNLEHVCSSGAAAGTFNTAQVLFLRSHHHPITTQLVRQALTILAKRVLVLQLCVAWRGWLPWPWYRRVRKLKVQLSESRDDPLEVYRRDLAMTYQVEEGPLWRATLVQQPAVDPEDGPHEAVLVLTIHHVVTDGTTNMVLSRDLLTIINGLVTGHGGHTPRRGLTPPASDALTSPCDVLVGISFLLSVIRRSVEELVGRGAAHLLPSPTRAPPATRAAVFGALTQQATTQLARRCKQGGVRIHSCLLTAATLAFLRTVRKNGQFVSSMKLRHETAVNIRRYYPASCQEEMGTVSFLLPLIHNVSEDQDFWAMAKSMQEDLYVALDQDRTSLRMSRLGWALGTLFYINKLLIRLGYRGMTYCHVTVTNMGDLRTLLPTTYAGPIEITGLLRSTEAELAGTYFSPVTQTLAGRLLVSIDNYTSKTTKETAKEYLDHFVRILTDVAYHGTSCKRGTACSISDPDTTPLTTTPCNPTHSCISSASITPTIITPSSTTPATTPLSTTHPSLTSTTATPYGTTSPSTPHPDTTSSITPATTKQISNTCITTHPNKIPPVTTTTNTTHPINTSSCSTHPTISPNTTPSSITFSTTSSHTNALNGGTHTHIQKNLDHAENGSDQVPESIHNNIPFQDTELLSSPTCDCSPRPR